MAGGLLGGLPAVPLRHLGLALRLGDRPLCAGRATVGDGMAAMTGHWPGTLGVIAGVAILLTIFYGITGWDPDVRVAVGLVVGWLMGRDSGWTQADRRLKEQEAEGG